MPDEQGRSSDGDLEDALARLHAILGDEVEEEEDPPEDLKAPLGADRSISEEWSPGPWIEGAIVVLWYGLAFGAFAFTLFVYPGWRAYVDLFEFILQWASDAP